MATNNDKVLFTAFVCVVAVIILTFTFCKSRQETGSSTPAAATAPAK